jgi:hypothetical protein
MGGDPGQVHAPGAVLDEEQYVQAAQEDGIDVEEVDGEDRLGLGLQARPPGLPGPPGRGINALYMPKTSSTSCDQAVLVDQASGVALPSNAVPGEIDRFGQRFQRRSCVQRPVRPVLIVVNLVRAQDPPQMSLVPHEGAVQELAPASADPAFHDRVHTRRPDAAQHDPDPGIGEDRVECSGESPSCGHGSRT